MPTLTLWPNSDGNALVRDGAPVTKTRLAVGPDAHAMRKYLKARANGIQRARAARESGLDATSSSSLIDIDRNALTYAGHTVWNRHAEREGGGYIGGTKMRPRAEWVIQRDTHEALISDDEAEAILAAVDTGKRRAGKPNARIYLLSGILIAPDGVMWNGDSGFYRIPRGPRIAAESVDRAVVEQVAARFSSDELAQEIANYYRKLSEPAKDVGREVAKMRRRIADIEKRIGRLTMLLSETSSPEALLRQIEALEVERETVIESVNGLTPDATMGRAMRTIGIQDVKRMLASLAEDLNAARPELLRDTLRQVIEGVTLDLTPRHSTRQSLTASRPL